ncbi:MAG TPA: sensor histidine kinase [Rectinemataceae bacterium]|nr:sensor histidine kinase [Rectinemataceae bacterium]
MQEAQALPTFAASGVSRETRDFRDHLVTILTRVIAVGSLVAIVPSVWLSIRERLWAVLVGDVAANVWVVLLALVPAFSYRAKVASLLFLSYALGLLLLLITGPFGAGHLYIFAFVFLAALFGGKTAIILANLLALLTHVILATAKGAGLLQWEQGLDSVIVISSNFVLVSIVLSFSAYYLVNRYAKAAEEEARMRAELEILLHEIEHRGKNNIQVISSLVNLKAKEKNDPAKTLDEIRASLSAIAAVHQLLRRREHEQVIEIRALIDELVSRYRFLHSGIVWRNTWQGDAVELDADRAVDLGLLINELVTNSIKHGFANGSQGSIFIEATHDGKTGRLLLRIGDDGKANKSEKEKAPEPEGGKGLRIVQTIARHLGAKMELESGQAWIYRISIVLEPPIDQGEERPNPRKRAD